MRLQLSRFDFWGAMLVCSLLVSSCVEQTPMPWEVGNGSGDRAAKGSGEPMLIKHLEVVNLGERSVEGLNISVERLANNLKVNRVLPGRAFTYHFGGKRYEGNSVSIKWKYDGVAYTASDLKFGGVEKNYEGKVVKIVVTVDRDRVKAFVGELSEDQASGWW